VSAADKLMELTGRLRRLRVDRHDPERFHLERDGICSELAGVARQLRGPQVGPVHAFNPKNPVKPRSER